MLHFFAITLSFLMLMVWPLTQAQAAKMKIQLSSDFTIDAETGHKAFSLLNPSTEVDLTFTETGLRLAFVNAAGKAEYRNIFFQSSLLSGEISNEESNPIQAEYLRIQSQLIEQIGPTKLIREALRLISEATQKNGGGLLVFFDEANKIGFVHNDYNANEIKLLDSNGNSQNLVSFALQLIDQQTRSILSQRLPAQTGEGIETRARPIGFSANLQAGPSNKKLPDYDRSLRCRIIF